MQAFFPFPLIGRHIHLSGLNYLYFKNLKSLFWFFLNLCSHPSCGTLWLFVVGCLISWWHTKLKQTHTNQEQSCFAPGCTSTRCNTKRAFSALALVQKQEAIWYKPTSVSTEGCSDWNPSRSSSLANVSVNITILGLSKTFYLWILFLLTNRPPACQLTLII